MQKIVQETFIFDGASICVTTYDYSGYLKNVPTRSYVIFGFRTPDHIYEARDQWYENWSLTMPFSEYLSKLFGEDKLYVWGFNEDNSSML